MLPLSKDKRSLKPSSKSLKPHPSKVSQEPTLRMSKSSNKITKSQNPSRSPQLIKLMIDQLEKQLITKTKNKHLVESDLTQTKRKLPKSKHPQLVLKSPLNQSYKHTQNQPEKTIPNFKPPSHKKYSKFQNDQTLSMFDKILENSFNQHQHLSQSHRPNSKNDKTNPNYDKKKPHKSQNPSKKSLKKHSKQNYIILNNDLIKYSNLQLPLFILDTNSPVKDKSEQYSLRNNNKSLLVDEKQTFMRHSKVPSLDSINSKSQKRLNHIQRSFCESDESEVENYDNLSFLKLTIFDKNQKSPTKSIPQHEDSSQQLTQTTSHSESPKLNIDQIIKLNNSVVKIQQWWRNNFKSRRNRKSVEQNKKLSLETIQTKEESQNQIQQISDQTSVQKQHLSLSQKNIASSDSNDPNDILKLRENAAYIQFSTHEQILKELLSKAKITQVQFEHQYQVIKQNLATQLGDIQKIQKILKESAEKVQNVMKKTKLDIIAVKKIVSSQEILKENAQGPKQTDQNSSSKKEDILSKIFGEKVQEPKQKSQHPAPRYEGSHQLESIFKVPPHRYKRIKIPTYDAELEEFSNQRSSDEENSFLSNSQNNKIFNSPNNNSEQNIQSPDNDENDGELSSSENLEEEIFSCEIESSPSVAAQETPAPSPFPMTANFEELYKEYQEQEQSKKQIETRISKQLGVPDLNQQQREPQISINTSIVAIHKFLLNFFKFYLYYHKNEFLTYMNMPYGESIETRLMKNKLKNPEYALQEWVKTTFYTEDDEQIIYGLKNVIPESILEEFFDSYYEETDIEFTASEKTNIELEKTHNRAVFHAFNSALNFFRPYYNIGGAPYLWCSSEKSLTFFCIGEDNIQEVYEKTQMKILKTSSHLCGIIIDVPHKNTVVLEKSRVEAFEAESPFKVLENQQSDKVGKKVVSTFEEYYKCYTENFNAAYLSNLQERLGKKQHAETEEENVEWFGNTFEEGKVSTLLNLTDLIEEILLLQECSILRNIEMERRQNNKQSNKSKRQERLEESFERFQQY